MLKHKCYNRVMENKKKLLLIDGSSVAFRAFFALYNEIDRFKNASGLHTNAIFGFQLMLSHLLERIQPSHVLVAFDAGKTTFRTEMFQDYKGGRAKTPDEFREQFPFIRQLLDVSGIRHYELERYEADDIIGTLAKQAEADGFQVVIVSGDKDLIQLADENTVVEISRKGVAEFEAYTPAYLQEKMGITPAQFIDLKALMGDKSDNIPGVTKIGEKTGLKLLAQYDSLAGIYENIENMKASKMKENLINDKDQAFLSKTLATIDTQAPIAIGLADLSYSGPQLEDLGAFYEEMGFHQLREGLTAQGLAPAPQAPPASYELVDDYDGKLSSDDFFHVEILGDNYHTEDILAFAWGNADQIYVSQNLDLLTRADFKAFLESQAIQTYDFKAVKVLLARLGVDLPAPSYDARLAKYLLSTVDKNDLTTISRLYGDRVLESHEDIYGKGAKTAVPEAEVLHQYVANKLAVIIDSKENMLAQLEQNDQLNLLYDMEQPLSYVLAKMEIAGIKVEAATLKEMEKENEQVLAGLTQEIYELAGKEFNINSPKQLGTILFEDMGLPLEYTKKTKTGYSTAVDVLERLAPIAPIVSKILDYRQIAKLQSTYVIGLQNNIMEDGKIHTRYVQDLTQTGRLSSVDPNLQNIPVRLEQGRLIRKAFVPEWDNAVLLSSDYSQIELRVLAHISEDSHLIEAFQSGADIHTSTAMRVFGISSPEEVSPNDRRNAKAVNFGVVYGISDFGLANNLGISRKEAKDYIDTYFERFPGIKDYMESIVREAKDKGYVETMFHRRRELPDINSRNFNLRSFAERTAINSPIQGSAADILKIAMIRLDRALVEGGYEARMLLQVHDEIVLEVPEAELEDVRRLVRETMESAVSMAVPLVVDENDGQTWYEAK